jgi:hypothetical protein
MECPCLVQFCFETCLSCLSFKDLMEEALLHILSSIVGALLAVYPIALGSTLEIFLQGRTISVISQNILIVLTWLSKVPPLISILTTLSFWYCKNIRMVLKAQLESCLPLLEMYYISLQTQYLCINRQNQRTFAAA